MIAKIALCRAPIFGLFTVFSACLVLLSASHGLAKDPPKIPAAIDVLKMKSPPAGRYGVTLVIEGERVKAEFVIKKGMAACVKSEKAPGRREVQGSTGRFHLIANGVFMIGLRGEGYTATQFWAFQADGSALIKEVPDRGEDQRAVPYVEG